MEKQILKLFLTKSKLRFNEMVKLLNVRSNKINYHLRKLIDKNMLEKEKEFYKLSNSAEKIIPYVSDKESVLPVVLIYLGKEKDVFLCKREKRPYKDLFGLPGGRIILGEDIGESVKRIMKEKYGIQAILDKINSVSLEHVRKSKKIIHSFLLIFVTANTKDKINFLDLEKNKSQIIKSDYKLINEQRGSLTNIQTIFSKI